MCRWRLAAKLRDVKSVFLLLLAVMGAQAVETYATVKRIVDGDTIEVSRGDGSTYEVRLLFVDTPEKSDNTHDTGQPEQAAFAVRVLDEVVPPSTYVRLWVDDKNMKDRYGRTLAVVYTGPQSVETAQDALIRRGASVYWRDYGDAPAPFHDGFLTRQISAKDLRRGLWDTNRAWMESKEIERDHVPASARSTSAWDTTLDGRTTEARVAAFATAGVSYADRTMAAPPSEVSQQVQSRTPPTVSAPARPTPYRAENGDIRGSDNDGDGRAESVYVRGYTRSDGTTVRGHYRASPSRK